MNTLSYINNTGIVPMSKLEKQTLELFKINNKDLVENMSDKEIYDCFKNTASFASTRLCIAFSGIGLSVANLFKRV